MMAVSIGHTGPPRVGFANVCNIFDCIINWHVSTDCIYVHRAASRVTCPWGQNNKTRLSKKKKNERHCEKLVLKQSHN